MKILHIVFILLLFFSVFGCSRNNSQVRIEEQSNVSMTNTSSIQIPANDTIPSYQANTSFPLIPNLSQINVSSDITQNLNSTSNISNLSVYPVLPPAPCIDSDGANISNAGFVTFQGKKFYDFCTGEENVKEYICTNNTLDSYITQCPFNYVCNSGACVPVQQTCTASNAGKDVSVSGIVTIKDSSGRLLNYRDKCVDIYNTQKYYCDGNQLAYEILPCTGNYTCNVNTGACDFR